MHSPVLRLEWLTSYEVHFPSVFLETAEAQVKARHILSLASPALVDFVIDEHTKLTLRRLVIKISLTKIISFVTDYDSSLRITKVHAVSPAVTLPCLLTTLAIEPDDLTTSIEVMVDFKYTET